MIVGDFAGLAGSGFNLSRSRTRSSASSRSSGPQLKVHGLQGRSLALVIGLATSLWAGLGITQAAQNAFDRVWAVPFKDRRDFIHSRLRGLALLVALGRCSSS
jgi:hypothetical protein